jgi:phage baseplate assembly protein W
MSVNPFAFSDASGTNESDRSTRIYKDISLSFTKHPITGDIARLTDADAIKRSVRNLINTNHYERPFHPEIGSDIRDALFEPVSPIVANLLARHVEDCITNFEPRVELSNVICLGDIDKNQYEVVIEFYILNAPPELQTLSVFLERLR